MRSLVLVLGVFFFCKPAFLLERPRQEPILVEAAVEKRDFSEKSGTRFMIATDHPLASSIGEKIYRSGGNVVDAFVASSFAICVLRPQSTGLFGGGFALVSWKGKTEAFDFRERAPKLATKKFYLDPTGKPIPNKTVLGPYAAGIPGTLPGLFLIHKRYGKLSWQSVVEPSIVLAKEGFSVYPDLERHIEKQFEKWGPEEKKIFAPSDLKLRSGQILVQKDLSHLLLRISKLGEKDFREGETANAIVHFYKAFQSFIDLEDLKKYKVKIVEPISGEAFGKKILSMPPPSSGVFLISSFQIYKELKNSDLFLPESEENRRARFVLSMRFSYKDRFELGGDPEFSPIPISKLLSKDYAKKSSEEILVNLKKSQAALPRTIESGLLAYSAQSFNTTHVSVLDEEGNAVSSTHSVNGIFGANTIVPGTGLFLNNTMDDFSLGKGVPNLYGLEGTEANEIAPGKTPLSSMSPSLLFEGNQTRPFFVIGSPGGSQIPSAISNTLFEYFENKKSLYEALSSPRYHHQFRPDILFVEPEAKKRGLPAHLSAQNVQYTRQRAKVFAIVKENSTLIGVSDPRGDGSPAGY